MTQNTRCPLVVWTSDGDVANLHGKVSNYFALAAAPTRRVDAGTPLNSILAEAVRICAACRIRNATGWSFHNWPTISALLQHHQTVSLHEFHAFNQDIARLAAVAN